MAFTTCLQQAGIKAGAGCTTSSVRRRNRIAEDTASNPRSRDEFTYKEKSVNCGPNYRMEGDDQPADVARAYAYLKG